MQVQEIMSGKLIRIAPEESAEVAARLLARHNIGVLPVCGRDGKLRGMVTDRDIVLRCVAAGEEPSATKVSDIMTRRIVSVSADASVEKAADMMAREQVRRLPVERDGKLIGLLSLGDLARLQDCTMEAAHALSEISENIRNL